MKCNCGQLLSAKSKFCPSCGAQVVAKEETKTPTITIMAQPRAYDYKTAGQMMGVSEGTIRNLIKRGVLAFAEPTEGRKVITIWEIERYLKSKEKVFNGLDTKVLQMNAN
ncbi:hypothetical protein SDC9_142035 [bioreactor metagenome]|uniref:Helix-turn-helix domain-containing protein n=1 Tax=bioreactor metagenome TaxID=1076179 RepID=A0A645DZY5_9ZZZZ